MIYLGFKPRAQCEKYEKKKMNPMDQVIKIIFQLANCPVNLYIIFQKWEIKGQKWPFLTNILNNGMGIKNTC